jgi:hypothetical protein
MKLSKGTIINVFNIRCVSNPDLDVPALIQVTLGETICNSGADSDSDASDYEGDEVDMDVAMRELGEYMFANHPYANIYDFDFQ